MEDLIREHLVTLIVAAVLLYLAWATLRQVARRGGHGVNLRLKVYCRHCNWEGMVQRRHWECSRCHSHDLSVLAA